MEKTKRAERAAKLEAEAKRLRREEKEFWDEVEERIDEIRKKYPDKSEVSDKYDKICRTYGCVTASEKEDLYRHIISTRQIEYYKKTIRKDDEYIV